MLCDRYFLFGYLKKQNRQRYIAHSQLGHAGAMLIQWWIIFWKIFFTSINNSYDWVYGGIQADPYVIVFPWHFHVYLNIVYPMLSLISCFTGIGHIALLVVTSLQTQTHAWNQPMFGVTILKAHAWNQPMFGVTILKTTHRHIDFTTWLL